ncbi:MAG: alpha/beta hydrolase family esterase [Myxococcales bacterium]
MTSVVPPFPTKRGDACLLAHCTLAMAAVTTAFFSAAPASAASLQKVEQSVWGTSGLPSYVNMYLYVPDKPATKPPVLVAAHHCQGTGQGTFNETKANLVPLADKNGFIMIFPEATGHNCWDVGSAKALKHDGGGDPHAIAQMVRYAISKYNGDPTRVYAFGGSSGAMMTEALMGIYPDLFAAGVGISGVPCGCWAEQYTGDVATNGQWSGPCAGGNVTKTAQQWGDLVRSAFPGYSGHRPRLQLWHGDPDNTISYKNLLESIKEWTNVLALSTTPTATDSSKSNTTHQSWRNACGFTVLETFAIKGADHAVNWDVSTVAAFLGLDKADGLDPEAAACPSTGGSGGAGGAGGSAVSTNTSSAGGKASSSVASQGGRGGSGANNSSASDGTRAVGGTTASRGGNSGRGQTLGNGGFGASIAGGSSGNGSGTKNTQTGATDHTGGTANDTSQVQRNGGGGNSSMPRKDSTGAPAKGGATEPPESSGQDRFQSGGDPPAEGCSCVISAPTRRTGAVSQGLLLAGIGLVLRRRRQIRR